MSDDGLYIVFKHNVYQKVDLDGMTFEVFTSYNSARQYAESILDDDYHDIAWIYHVKDSQFRHVATCTYSSYFQDKYHGYVEIKDE